MSQKNEQVLYIEKEIESVKRKYLSNAIDIISDFNNENKTKNDYKGRQIYELMQNADDCFNEECPEIKIKFVLKDNLLIILNNGSPFDGRGVASLMHPDASSKYENTIGCKGLGFRSVLNWSTDISIYTIDFNIHFTEKRATELLDYYKNNTDKTHVAELEKINRIAVLSSATVDNNEEEKKIYLEDGYSTAVVLKCEEKYIDVIQKQLIELQFEELLFLKHIRMINIVSPQTTREIVAIKENDSCGIEENNKSTWWQVWSDDGLITQVDGSKKKYELSIAYNDDPQIRENIRNNGCLYSYFKTDMPMPLPFLIHGTFNLSSERNKLVKDDDNNKQLLSLLVDFIIKKSIEIAGKEGKCDYEALKFAVPSKEVYFLDSEYGFSKIIKEKIKRCKVFPSINDEYLSLDDEPKYSDYRFDEVVNKHRFSKLLKHCDDNKILSFINECNINFYKYEDFCDFVSADGDEYVSSGRNVDIIALYLKQYGSYAKYGPYLLTDTEGKRIIDKNAKVFDNPVYTFDLPAWSEMRFINHDLEKKLSEVLDARDGRDLVNKLSIFNMEEYSFDKVVNELNKQCDSVDKVKDLLKWLFNSWLSNNQSFPSSLSKVDIKIITRNGEISPCSNCYFGNEYDNKIGEKIVKLSSEESAFIADKTNIGLEDADNRLLSEFLQNIGVKRFPRIENIKLDVMQNREYLDYNSKLNPIIYTDKGETKANGDFLFRLSTTTIRVDSIIGIENILNTCEFEEIIYWIIHDPDLYQHIASEFEMSEKSSISGYPKSTYTIRTVKKTYMSSWIRKIFIETKWLNTKNGDKSNCLNVMFADYNLSPIVETININYDKLKDLCGRRIKSDADVIFEKLGVVEEFAYLPKEKIYESLLKLPELDNSDFSIGKTIYSQLNNRINADDVDELLSDNMAYDEFISKGSVLAKQNGKTSYMSHKEVYYVENKIYSNEILDKFPTLVLSKRAGKNKIKRMFGVKPIDEFIKASVVEKVEHPCNLEFQEYYQKLLPYLYSRRVGKDNKNSDFNRLRRTKVMLVSDAMVKYSLNNESFPGKLSNYELIYADDNAFIKIPNNVNSIEDLKQTANFRTSFAEVITTIFKVESDKDAYMNMLSFKDLRELEEYLKDTDENLVSLNRAKELFGDQVDYKQEFWNALQSCTEINQEELINNYSYLISDNFDYINPDPEIIIKLFKLLSIDVSDYNNSAFRLIHLEGHYSSLFNKLKAKYRERYLTIKVMEIINKNGIKEDYDVAVKEYDFKERSFENSVNIDVYSIFENTFDVLISDLEKVNDKLDELVSLLKEKPTEEFKEPEEASQEDGNNQDRGGEEPIDFEGLNNEIAEDTDDTVLEAVTEKPEPRKSRNKAGKKDSVSKAYDTSINKKKELNGFIAESKVYNTLLKIISDNGSVVWVSSNGEKAKKCIEGDDSLGYDIKYVIDGVIHYVEVKGTSGKVVEFTLSRNEYEFGIAHKDNYELWFVFIEDDGEAGDPIQLGNIFVFKDNESFFDNSKFSVEQNEFKIRAKIKNNS